MNIAIGKQEKVSTEQLLCVFEAATTAKGPGKNGSVDIGAEFLQKIVRELIELRGQ
ncbi:MAG: hypothetical protein [Bacteriophage sp.]|nr:MAG: hypothetical protein [Bacteriophage sp.]